MTPESAHAWNAAITTERLLLEPLTSDHAGVLFAPMQDERIYRWISLLPPTHLEHLRRSWRAAESRVSPTGEEAWLNWAVRRASDGEYVGKCDAAIDASRVATNVGYLFFPAHWKQGYATESVVGLVRHFSAHGIRELHALVTAGNGASERVLVRAGFVRARTIPGNDTIRGEACDDIEYLHRASA